MSRTSDQGAVARLAASWLLWYPDAELVERMPQISAAVATLPPQTSSPLSAFLDHLDGTPLIDIKPYFASTDSAPDAVVGWHLRK